MNCNSPCCNREGRGGGECVGGVRGGSFHSLPFRMTIDHFDGGDNKGTRILISMQHQQTTVTKQLHYTVQAGEVANVGSRMAQQQCNTKIERPQHPQHGPISHSIEQQDNITANNKRHQYQHQQLCKQQTPPIPTPTAPINNDDNGEASAPALHSGRQAPHLIEQQDCIIANNKSHQ